MAGGDSSAVGAFLDDRNRGGGSVALARCGWPAVSAVGVLRRCPVWSLLP